MGGSSKHVLPVYLDGAAQSVSITGDNDWDGLTSSVTLSAASGTLRLKKPDNYGTLIHIKKTGSGSVDVKPYIEENEGSLIKTLRTNETVTVIYNGTTWLQIADTEISETPDTLFKEFYADIDFSLFDGTSNSFDQDSVFDEVGALDVTTPEGYTATKIIVHFAAINITTAAGSAKAIDVILSDTAGVAARGSASGTNILGLGTALQGGESAAANIAAGSTGLTTERTNVPVDLDRVNVYARAAEEVEQDMTAGVAKLVIRYSLI
jgi:hypothetical protein